MSAGQIAFQRFKKKKERESQFGLHSGKHQKHIGTTIF